jgi:hypothetical protein
LLCLLLRNAAAGMLGLWAVKDRQDTADLPDKLEVRGAPASRDLPVFQERAA